MKLLDVCEAIVDCPHSTAKDEGKGYPLIRTPNIGKGRLKLEGVHRVSADVYDKRNVRAVPQENDLILAREAPVGNVAIIKQGQKVCLGQRTVLIRPNQGLVDPCFLTYYLLSPQKQHALLSASNGATVSHLNMSAIRALDVELPDMEIQRKIGRVLSELDDKIEANNCINENLSAQIDMLLLAYLDNEGALPVKLGDYLYIKGRIGWKGLKKSEYLPQSEYRIINGETLTQSGINWNKAGYISEERYVESPEIMLKVGDILLSKDGTIGKIGYVDSLELPTSVASGIFVIRNTKPEIISTTFIYYLLKSRLFTSFIAARTEGSVIPHLYQKDFMEFEFPLPTVDKMAEFKEITEPMFSQIINNLNENKRLALLRDSLLPKLMSGELDVSELKL